MKTYLTIRNVMWVLCLAPYPVLELALTDAQFYSLPYAAGPASFMLFLLAAFYTPKAVIDTRRRRRFIIDDRCLACGYSLVGSLDAGRRSCPECGHPIPPWRLLLRSRQREDRE